MSKKRGRPCLGPGKLRSPAKRALVEGGLTPTICSVYTNQDHNYLGFLHAVARRGLKFEQISVAKISWKEVAFADSIRSAKRGAV